MGQFVVGWEAHLQSKRSGLTQLQIIILVISVIAILMVVIIVVLAGIGVFFYRQAVDDAKVTAAQLKAKGDLTTACKTYKVKVGNYPASLRDLLLKTPEGFGPFLENEQALLDPWNQEYKYDPAGPHNNGTQPDIWTTTPKGIVVGNWP
jgi:hypothetical protein